MTETYGFELVREEQLPELKSLARLYRHVKTGAELISVINDDENKAFNITFRTPPTDSTGVAHILEHSVLCGSRKFPLKEPFIELVKGSLNTFLNAMTGSAETYYPVASLNERDFYNLVDVYLDAVFFPRLTPQIFQQEGWHYELSDKNEPLIYKGVVFNEMKGAYQSPDTILYDQAERSLFPDHVYGVSSGGEPKKIPDLTWEMLDAFHKKYYHPSNARIWFWGDDNPEERLRLLDSYLSLFDARPPDSEVPLAPHFSTPKRMTIPYAVGAETETEPKAMMSMNWVLTDTISFELDLAMEMLKHILTGTPASPLRKALIDSGLVEHVGAGVSDIRQRSFRMGMKGLAPENSDKVEKLVFETLTSLANGAIENDAIEAAVNTVEFGLRELNTGGFPRGLAVAFYALSTWLYDGDPFTPLHFEGPLESIKKGIAAGNYFENMIRTLFLENNHRTTIVYLPDPGLAERETEEERKKLDAIRASMSEADVDRVIAETKYLQELQQTPDSEEALATLPRLTLQDLDPNIKTVPTEKRVVGGASTHYHDLFTNGIVYLDLGFDLRVLPQDLLPYLPLFGRSLLQMGTQKEDFVKLTQRIGRKTGGVWHENLISSAHGQKDAIGRLFLRSKATPDQAAEQLGILSDIILTGRLDNQERFKQMVTEERVRLESSLTSSGHAYASRRLSSRFSQAGWVGEQMGGFTYVNFIRDLCDRVNSDWPSVQAKLEQIKSLLFNRNSMLVNVTLDEAAYQQFEPRLAELVASIPGAAPTPIAWNGSAEHVPEAFTIPGQVNFVGKAVNLCDFGYDVDGSALVVNNLLRTTWLWEKVRVEGGAYGGFCSFDHISGQFTFLSYRDPNLLHTLENYDASAQFLRNLDLSEGEITRNIIGTISDLDGYQLPDAKGWSAMVRDLIGENDETRQRRRDQVLGTKLSDIKSFGDVLASAVPTGQICVFGATDAVEKANESKPGWLKVTKAL
jgi:hypothetical protein